MDSPITGESQPPLEYGRTRAPRRRRVWRVLRRVVLWSLPVLVYVLLYVGFARRQFFMGLLSFSYPGAVRFYATSGHAAESLGHSDESIESARDAGMKIRRFDDSLYHCNPAWYSGLWRVFYPLERIEIQIRGGSVVPIRYPGATVSAGAIADPAKLPLVGTVYREWFIRDERLYRFMAAEYGGRNGSFEPEKRTDIYLFEWDLSTPFESTPRPAARARLVDSTRRVKWDDHWLVDADRYLTWERHSERVSLLQFAGEQQPARVAATLERVSPVRCDVQGSISVSRSGRFFAGERNGLFVFDARTLMPLRQIYESAALTQFFAARAGELSNTNSQCFLTDDGKLLVRVITFFGAPGGKTVNGTAAAVYDIENGSTREISLNVGSRTDIKDVEWVEGKLLFYVQSTTTGKEWPHQIVDENLHPIVAVGPPSTHTGLERLAWEPSSARLAELPGFAANPQALELDSEILVQDAHSGRVVTGVIRYGDSAGFPKLFKVGMRKLKPY
jgi:hypothetical protein